MSAVASGVFDLREQNIWDAGRLVASAFRWPGELRVQRLGDVATRLEPRQLVGLGTQVVTPEGLDHLYGGIRRRATTHQGPCYLVGGAEANLQPGDVLVAARSGVPALMIETYLLGSTISAAFSAYRFLNIDDAYWVWGVLSSTSGQSYLRGAMTDTMSSQRPRVGDLIIPWPDDGWRLRLRQTLAAIESRTHRPTEDATETWWSIADLREVDWRAALATPEPEQLLSGMTLVELGLEITVGRPFGRAEALTIPTEGALPVVNGGVLAGRPMTRWLAEKAESSIVEPGDVLVAAVGDRANARVAEQRAIIDTGVYRLRVPAGLSAESVVAFLNGQVGHGLRRLALSGSASPRVSLTDLRQLRVTEGAFTGHEADGPLRPLAEQLELVLWTS